MASIDSCIDEITGNQNALKRVHEYAENIRERTAGLSHLFVTGRDLIPDPCKLLICCRDGSMSGQQIYDILRSEYDIQTEMAGDFYALAILTGYDRGEDIERLILAINEMDAKIDTRDDPLHEGGFLETPYPEAVLSLAAAWDADTQMLDISEAAGRIAGDFVNLYPPGIPLIVPGERISAEMIGSISHYINTGRCVQGVETDSNRARRISVIRRDDDR